MEMVGAILFAVLLYVITTELSLFVARRRARIVPPQTMAAGSGGHYRRGFRGSPFRSGVTLAPVAWATMVLR